MSSMMEFTAEKTPLTKNTDRKKGMTLVEVMAAMGILSILFVAISGLMINAAKIENRADKMLESNNYLKSALLLFDTGAVTISNYYIEQTIGFEDINDMQNKMINNVFGESGKLEIKILAEVRDGGIFKITAKMNEPHIENKKIIYVNRK